MAAYQVTTSMHTTSTREREEMGLLNAMETFNLKEGYIITKEEAEEKKLPNGKVIHTIPYYRWVLDDTLNIK